MAKARDLAALAGLAGLAYAMRGKGDTSTTDTGDEVDRLKKRGNADGQMAVNKTNTDVLSAITAPKKVEDTSNYSNEGRNAISASSPVSVRAKPLGMTGGQNDMLAGANKTPINPIDRSDQLSAVSRASKREAKTKQFAQDTPEELSAQKTDSLAVSSRAARAADARRRMAKQSSYKSGGMTSSASSRADGIATKGKTRGKIC
jgi:hypothetical protein